MKKLISILGCAVFIGIAAISCKQMEPDGNSSAGELKKGFIEVDAEAVKTALDPSTSNIVWQAGDKVGLFTADGVLSNTEATLVAGGEGSSQGAFVYTYEGTVSSDIYAYYPYAEGVSFSSGKFSNLVLPDKQVYETLSDAVRACILVGKQGADKKIHFKNTLSIAQVSLTGDSELSQLALWARDESLSGYGVVELIDGMEPLFEVNTANTAASGKSTGAVYATKYTGSSKTDGTALTTLTGTPYSLYFVIPALEYYAGDLLMDIVTPGYSVSKVSANGHFFFRSCCKPFTAINVSKPEYTNLTDLSVDAESKAAYSNCYLVKPSSSDANYSIAERAADGSLRYGTSDASTDAPGATARVVWETKEGLVNNVSVDWTNKTIRFTVPGTNTPGSAIIALVNQYSNTIYWVWHIWISDVKEQQWGDSPTFLDRNVGAEWSPKTFAEVEALTKETALTTSGLLFQYGNSYPFPRANTMEPESTGKTRNQEPTAFGQFTQKVTFYRFNKWTQGFFSTGRKLVSESANYEMDDLRWFPMTCNYCNESDTDAKAGAAWASNVDPYGDGAKYSWGRGTSKARRDPCPVGYRIPGDKQMTWFRRSVTGTSADGHSYYWQYDLGSKGYVCSAFTKVYKSFGAFQTTEWKRDQDDKGNGEVIWFPMQGVRLGKGFGNAGAMERNGYYYDASSNAASGCSYFWCVAPEAGTTIEGTSTIRDGKGSSTSTGECWFVDTGNLFQYGFLSTSSACSVRCVKMTAADTSDSYLDAGGLTDGGTDPNPWE